MKSILRLIAGLYTWYHLKKLQSKGERTTTVSMEPLEKAMVVKVTSIQGYKLTFTCRKIRYVFTYANTPSEEKHYVYKLYASSDDVLPVKLRDVIKHEVYLPRLFSLFMDERTNRTIMMNIFIAVLKEKFETA